jgi:hypothetical protein
MEQTLDTDKKAKKMYVPGVIADILDQESLGHGLAEAGQL